MRGAVSSDSSCLRSCLRAVQKLQGMANRPWKQEAQHLVPRMAWVCRRCDTVWRTHKDYLWWCKHIQSKCQPQIEEWHVVWDIMKLWKDSLGTVAKPLPRPVISHSGLRSMPSDDNHRSTVHFKATISAAWKKGKLSWNFNHFQQGFCQTSGSNMPCWVYWVFWVYLVLNVWELNLGSSGLALESGLPVRPTLNRCAKHVGAKVTPGPETRIAMWSAKLRYLQMASHRLKRPFGNKQNLTEVHWNYT